MNTTAKMVTGSEEQEKPWKQEQCFFVRSFLVKTNQY